MKYTPDARTVDRVMRAHSFHPADKEKQEQHEAVRNVTRVCAAGLLELCPESRELSLALTALQDAMMWANAAIAIHQGAK